MIYVFRYSLIALYTVFWGALACVLGLVDRSGEAIVWIGRRWVRWCLATCGVRVEAEGLDQLPVGQPVVFMSNHQSVFDIAAIIDTLPRSWRFVAKRELTWIPFFGWALVIGGHIIIDRSRRAKAVRSLARGAERIRDGANVIIFPEGTRSPTGELRPFKSGGFHLARQAGVSIVPVTVSGSLHVTPKKSLRIESGRILVRYGKPIATVDFGDDEREALKEQVYRAIAAGYDPNLQRGADSRRPR
ncbi:MAG: 1-acyl-sn-glycerol-3-phosphate acyltransferase [Proteobacteria bacterium]|nr:1-acyl-sn-glycerol-3-phosphate acyltransferase [Pseudomonadota bacterium]